MSWRDVPPLTTEFGRGLPELPGIALAAVDVGAVEAPLYPEEEHAVARSVEGRVHEFRAGRHAARCALADLGLAPCAIPRRADRRPVWPAGVAGSISHAGTLAVAAVARADIARGLGVDLEACGRVTPALHAKLFTPAERDRYAEVEAEWPTLLFSAKEAGYKAVNPLAGQFIGFQEAEVDVDWVRREFRLRYVGAHAPSRIMDRGLGHFAVASGYVLTVFAV
jgi:4'-phosphopantetheinyl transferase EntD